LSYPMQPLLPIITGHGLVTPLGTCACATWDALLRGETIRTHARTSLPPCDRNERVTQLAVHVAREATSRAGWSATELSSDDSGVVVGTSKGPVETWMTPPPATSDKPPDVFGLAHVADGVASALRLGYGPRLTLSAACASGLHALIRGAMLIRSAQCRRVLVVASESSLHPLFVASFKRLGVLPPEGFGCKPFDVHRDGFLMSEAAAAVCLEAADPDARGDNVAVDRFALGGDAIHLTGSDPDAAVLRHLLHEVVDGGPVDLVHAHGTGTATNDPIELAAIEAEIGDDAAVDTGGGRPNVYSHKGALGHSLGAAGLVAVVVNVMCHRRGTVPPNASTTTPLPTKGVEISRVPVERRVRRSLATAAGFGGPTAVVSLFSR